MTTTEVAVLFPAVLFWLMLIVQYGRRVPRQLQHDGQGRFVSNDGRFVLRFGMDDEGRPYAVSLSLPAALA